MTDITNICLPNGVPFDQHGNPRVRFVRMTVDGSFCIMPPHHVPDMVGNSEPGSYTLEDVYLSQQEFDALPEFDGF